MKAINLMRGIAAAAFLSGAMLATAQEPDYSYIEAGYGLLEIDESNSSGEGGFWAGFSARMGEPLYLEGSFQRFDIDTRFGSADLDLAKINLGFRTAISDGLDFNAELGYDRLDFIGVSSDGFRGALGVRASTAENFQSRLYAGYTTDDDEGDYFIGAEATIPFSETFAFTLQAETFEFDVTILRGGVRVMF